MGDKLTKQDKGFVKDLIENGNATQAVIDNYGIEDPNYAGVKGNRLLRKAKIVNAIQTLAEQIPDELIIEKHLALLNKEEVVTKNNMTTGEVDVIPTGEIDVQAVSKGLDMAYKLKGSYAPDKSIHLNIKNEMTADNLSKIEAFNEWHKNQIKQPKK